MADDEDETFGGLYEDGHWVWDDDAAALAFASDLPPKRVETVQVPIKVITGTIEFRDDVDLIEQIRYRRRYQRKLEPGQPDTVTLQDVKDLAIYTAPTNILSPMLINMLHVPTTERFLRALILYMAYYLQVSDIMANRVLELETKVRTPFCTEYEGELRSNLSDLRILVAKEYSIMLMGAGDTKKYHHMGASKKQKSLSDKDARFFEMLIRFSVQIVWVALGRKSFHQIELEVGRIFKSEIFNSVEHTLKTGYMSKLAPEERSVLFGDCLRFDKKLCTRSPLGNEVFCSREIDFKALGLGLIEYSSLPHRTRYLWMAIAGKEDELEKQGVVLGIIGMSRKRFDTMLKPIPQATEKSKATMSSATCRSTAGARLGSSSSMKKSMMGGMQRLYPDIVIPRKMSDETDFPVAFPDRPAIINPVNNYQRLRWLNRYKKLTHPN